ncbi:MULTISPECIES: DUF3263 domain-containing protein [unclassified Micromonospora]|uniref:DUF3263 domain-containing protein n=1 Tax=unclassified Micromonospora TaxID=2617518 RepID=UPI001C250119|nr:MULTISPECIES: DUF3263 domain-containing protein [unclassified Micromonospora]MBU8857381.1 DUF3263 domain-containing protein [Micromonospora sp. WMMB482]MDM4783005.1 DUF3263 domain-containing protein [Micromonospora sp. b486]
MSADASQRADPPGPTAGTRHAGAVPPPRTAPPVESTPPDRSVPADDAAPLDDAAPPGGAASAPAPPDGGDGLTERERRILAFEAQWWKHAGAKEQAIRDTFGLSATRYYQLLNALLDQPAALAAEPVLIGRLRRLRSSRARNRRR